MFRTVDRTSTKPLSKAPIPTAFWAATREANDSGHGFIRVPDGTLTAVAHADALEEILGFHPP